MIELKNLLQISDHLEDYSWDYFRDGIDIHRLYGDGIKGPAAALLHFRKAAPIPPHVHEGYEHLIVLHGRQKDAYGDVEVGTLRIHSPGTAHQGMAEAGCIVLAIYEKPVKFI